MSNHNTTETARQTLLAIREILNSAKSRVLTESEKGELSRLCAVLERGIAYRPIYSAAAYQFSKELEAWRNGTPTDELLEEIDGLKRLLG